MCPNGEKVNSIEGRHLTTHSTQRLDCIPSSYGYHDSVAPDAFIA
jgi:hypothetical protein